MLLRRLFAPHPTGLSCRFHSRIIHGGSHVTQQQPGQQNPVSHSTEDYFVDGDDTPPPNGPIYKVDPTSDAAQSAYEPPPRLWSWANAEMEESRRVSKDKPYDVLSGPEVKLGYGGRKRYIEDEGPETSKARPGPPGSERRSRKPEGNA